MKCEVYLALIYFCDILYMIFKTCFALTENTNLKSSNCIQSFPENKTEQQNTFQQLNALKLTVFRISTAKLYTKQPMGGNR